MKYLRCIGTAVVGGVVITLLTGLLQNNQLIGGTWYGYPLGWLVYRVLAPQYNPWYPIYTNLVVDVIFWAVIIGIIMYIADYAKNGGKQKAKKKSR